MFVMSGCGGLSGILNLRGARRPGSATARSVSSRDVGRRAKIRARDATRNELGPERPSRGIFETARPRRSLQATSASHWSGAKTVQILGVRVDFLESRARICRSRRIRLDAAPNLAEVGCQRTFDTFGATSTPTSPKHVLGIDYLGPISTDFGPPHLTGPDWDDFEGHIRAS